MSRKKRPKDITLLKLFYVFVIGCLIGVVWEEGYLFIKRYLLDYSDVSWRSHAGLLYGPFNPVYGVGALLTMTLYNIRNKNIFVLYVAMTVLGGITEYLASYFQEIVLNTSSWNYSHIPFNIDGRTNIYYMLFFGFLGVIFLKIIYPNISKLINKINSKPFKIITIIFFIFFILNIIISIWAVDRQNERKSGIPPENVIDEYCDKHYHDEYLKEIYVNMKPTKK